MEYMGFHKQKQTKCKGHKKTKSCEITIISENFYYFFMSVEDRIIAFSSFKGKDTVSTSKFFFFG